MTLTSPLDLPCPSLPRLPARAADAHKGDFGNALLVGGSRGMAGAIALAGMAAVRVGAGLVRLAVPDRCLENVSSYSPCTMTIPLADDDQGRIALPAIDMLQQQWERADCVAIGPGMGQSRDLQGLLLRWLQSARCPVVIDADGLNNLSRSHNWRSKIPADVVLTPHPGEWSRLCGVPADDRPGQCQAAVAFCQATARLSAPVKTTVVLKGQRTFITDGQTVVRNATGTPAMATGGSGDVLTGIITGLICQGLTPRDAAHLGVHVHGQAAEIAQRELRSHVVLPTELVDFLPRAFLQT